MYGLTRTATSSSTLAERFALVIRYAGYDALKVDFAVLFDWRVLFDLLMALFEKTGSKKNDSHNLRSSAKLL